MRTISIHLDVLPYGIVVEPSPIRSLVADYHIINNSFAFTPIISDYVVACLSSRVPSN